MKYIYEDLITRTILENYGVDISDNSLSAMFCIQKADLNTNIGVVTVFMDENEQLDFEFTINGVFEDSKTCIIEKF